MHVNRKPRRRHSDELKAQVLTACAEPGASVAAVARTFGLNDNLVHQWRRGRGFEAGAKAAASAPEFVALSLPAPQSAASAPSCAVPAPAEEIRMEFKRGGLRVSVSWPLSAAADSAAWLRELLR